PPYDAELFGHWWFEGPRWLEPGAREMVRGGVTPATLGEALAGVPPRATLALPEGSWGEGGDHRVWLNRDTEWTWDRVYSAEAEWAAHLAAGRTAKGDLARVLTQATRELLLLQASDWQFLITTGTARDYAERRVAEHYADFKRLSEMARGLASGESLSPDDANSRASARLLRHGRPAADALRAGLVPGDGRRRAPEPEPDRRLQRRRHRDLWLGPHLPDGRDPDARVPPGGGGRRHDRGAAGAHQGRVRLRSAGRRSEGERRPVRREASNADAHARRSGPRPRLDGQLPLFASGAHRRAPGRRAAVHRPRLRSLDHPRARARRARLRLRLPIQ